MTSSTNKENTSWKKILIEWGLIVTVAVIVYAMGWHTEVIGTMQRAMLWTGLFDADTTQIATTDGPKLTNSDYNFSLATEDAQTVSLSDFKGKVLFINVWASWCAPCVAEMPTIETLYKNIGDNKNIRVILLSMDEKRQKAVSFMKNKEFPMPYYFPRSRLPVTFQSSYIPATFVISKEGQMVYKREGIADYSSPNFAQWLIDLAES